MAILAIAMATVLISSTAASAKPDPPGQPKLASSVTIRFSAVPASTGGASNVVGFASSAGHGLRFGWLLLVGRNSPNSAWHAIRMFNSDRIGNYSVPVHLQAGAQLYIRYLADPTHKPSSSPILTVPSPPWIYDQQLAQNTFDAVNGYRVSRGLPAFVGVSDNGFTQGCVYLNITYGWYTCDPGNLAKGYPTGASLTAGWIASPGHRAPMVDPTLKSMTCAAYVRPDGRDDYVGCSFHAQNFRP